ncbi:MAG TPA: tetratricopeptide repeat protein, partial [Ktedonobacterales bacterium]|nr:tetratricopeptide repeat protein [Ktedonobacterales bacterium]
STTPGGGRAALGRQAGSMLALAAVLIVGLSAAGAGGVVASPQLHSAQAHSLEGSQTWAAAIQEYMLAGEQPPNALDIARTLDEQGEQQLAQGDYKDALATFSSVGTQYAQSGDPVGRANDDVFKTYSAWVKSNGSDVPYSDAISFFEQYRTASSCSASCASAAADIEAQALYQYGTSLAASSDYTDAITQFEKITASFASSSYAAQAHTAAATAYLARAKQELSVECAASLPAGESPTTALADYQKLVSTYSDTPEGMQAKAALAAPQNVVGHFQTAMHNTALFLSKQLNLSSGFESDNYRTTIGASSTTFTFTRVAQGKYYVTFVDNTGTPFYIGALNNPTLFPVGPLCA